MNSSRFGIIALGFPPQIGGMEEHARGVAEALSATDHVVVYTRPGNGVANAQFEQRAVITGDLARDWEVLHDENVDIWLGLNAGYVALAPRLKAPMFAYFHGNDFLNPWVGTTHFLPRLLRNRPYVWRYADPCQVFLRRRAIKHGAKSARHIFANSTFTRRLIKDGLSIPSDKITVIHPGVGNAFFRTEHSEKSDELRILTVARLTTSAPKKNIEGCLRAIAALVGRMKIRYTIVGNGDDRARLQNLASDLGIQHHVQFLGERAPSEMPRFYRDADLFLLASKRSQRDIESFGIAYLEAAASGVPSICSAEGGSTDAVLDGVSGIVIPNSTPETIAEGILQFANSRAQFSPEKVRSFAEGFRRPQLVRQMRARIIAELERSGDRYARD